MCANCTGSQCLDLSTDLEPIEIECPSCGGRDNNCPFCNYGKYTFNGCPNTFCSDMVPTIELVDLFERGLPPVAGGVLNQSAWFISVAQFLKRETCQQKK